jgi:UDP-N-acetylglucosamine 1-carboxyvinyltransferase
MDKIRIIGGNELHGIIPISGAKNAALPLLIASMLTDETLILDNVPRLADVAQLKRILSNHGTDIMTAGKQPGDADFAGETLHISAKNIVDTTAPYDLVSTMRASFWVIGPLLARMHEAKVSLPGGCAIGTRPVDLFLMALEKLGANLTLDAGYVIAKAPGGLKGATITFPKVTVGATHVAMMAATLAKGVTILENAARLISLIVSSQWAQKLRVLAHQLFALKALKSCMVRVMPWSPIVSRLALTRWQWR